MNAQNLSTGGRMYRRFVLVLMILLVATAANAGDRRIAGLSIGMGFPQGPEYVQDFWKSGIGGAVSLGTDLLPELTLHTIIEAHAYPFDEKGILERSHRPLDSISLIGDDARIISGLVMLKMNIMPPEPGISPYITAGVGLASVNIPGTIVDYIGDATYMNFGTEGIGSALSVGAGIDAYFNSNFCLFTEFRYMKIFANLYDIEYFTVRFGVLIDF